MGGIAENEPVLADGDMLQHIIVCDEEYWPSLDMGEIVGGEESHQRVVAFYGELHMPKSLKPTSTYPLFRLTVSRSSVSGFIKLTLSYFHQYFVQLLKPRPSKDVAFQHSSQSRQEPEDIADAYLSCPIEVVTSPNRDEVLPVSLRELGRPRAQQ